MNDLEKRLSRIEFQMQFMVTVNEMFAMLYAYDIDEPLFIKICDVFDEYRTLLNNGEYDKVSYSEFKNKIQSLFDTEIRVEYLINTFYADMRFTEVCKWFREQ